jgi:hypothetical protein
LWAGAHHAPTPLGRHIAEAAPSDVLPELAATDLADEVEIRQSVAIHVGHRHAEPVIVMHRLVILRRVVDHATAEGDAGLGKTIGEPEVVKCADLIRSRHLRRAPCVEPGGVVQVSWH